MVAGVGKAKKEVREGFLEALWEGCKHALGEAVRKNARERLAAVCLVPQTRLLEDCPVLCLSCDLWDTPYLLLAVFSPSNQEPCEK